MKKIDEEKASAFFEEFYADFISKKEIESHKQQLMTLKENFPVFSKVKQRDFDENLDAANLQLMGAAWTKYTLSKRISLMEGVDFSVKCLSPLEKKYGLDELEDLNTQYNQAFGSSYTDGNTAMAVVFIENIVPNLEELASENADEVQQTILFISQQFANTFMMNDQIIRHSGLLK